MYYGYNSPFRPFENALRDVLDSIVEFFVILVPLALLLFTAFIFTCFVIKYRRSSLSVGIERHARGIVFGRFAKSKDTPPRLRVYSDIFDEGHVGVFGGSGFGKTSALLIPSLRSWDYAGSLCIDISGDISSNCDNIDKIVFNPLNPHTIPYNVFGLIDYLPTIDAKNEALSKLAYLIIPDKPTDNAAAKYYANGSRNILTASLIAFYHQGWDFVQICRHIVETSQPDLFSEIDRTENRDAILYINGFVRPDGSIDNNVAGCKESCNSVVLLFATNVSVANALRRPAEGETCITPDLLESQNIFVRIEEEDLDLFAPLMRIIAAQALQFLSRRSLEAEGTIGLFLDEFKALGPIGDFSGALARLRKRNVRVVVLTQSMADLETIYGKNERRAMMNNMKYIVLLNVRDVDEQEYFAKMIGKHMVRQRTRRGFLNFKDITASKREEYIIRPQDLANLGNHLILLYPGGHMRIWKNYYFT